jgi:hypothetical protein
MTTNSGPNPVENGLLLSIDAGNLKSYSPNYITAPLDLFSIIFSGSRATSSKDPLEKSPAGGIPVKMVTTGGDPQFNISPVVSVRVGETWTASVWVKSNRTITSTGQLYLLVINSSGGLVSAPSTVITFTPTWQRISVTFTLANAATDRIYIRLDGPDVLTSGDEIWWDGAQLEKSSSATTLKPYLGATIKDLSLTKGSMTQQNMPYISNEQNAIVFTRTDTTPKLGGGVLYIGTGPLTSANFLYQDHSWEVLFKINDRNPGNYDGTEAESAICAFKGYHAGFLYNASSMRYLLWNGTSAVNTGNISLGTSETDIIQGQWAHLCATKNSTAVKVYLNGKLKINTPTTPALNTGITNQIRFGAMQSLSTDSFGYLSKSALGLSRMYNRELSAVEVLQNFNSVRSRYGL